MGQGVGSGRSQSANLHFGYLLQLKKILPRRERFSRIVAWADGVTDVFADSELRFFSVTYGRERVLPYWAAIVQVFNHETHHRGQVTTLLKQLGKDPGVTDFPWMPYFD